MISSLKLNYEKAKCKLTDYLFSCNFCFLFSFHEISRSTYMVELQADDDLVFISVPENVTRDVAGNKNLASNFLQVRHCKIFFFCLFICFLVIVLLVLVLYFVCLVNILFLYIIISFFLCIYFIHNC